MPCNGLVYNPPHPCACYIEAKLYGFNALAPASKTCPPLREVPDAGRLERGPAYASLPSTSGRGAGGEGAFSQGRRLANLSARWVPQRRHQDRRTR